MGRTMRYVWQQSTVGAQAEGRDVNVSGRVGLHVVVYREPSTPHPMSHGGGGTCSVMGGPLLCFSVL